MLEVDVFQHPRICDEFSHLMKRCLLASASLSLSLCCNQLMFNTFLRLLRLFSESLLQPIDVSHILKALEDPQTYCIALKENFELLDECLK